MDLENYKEDEKRLHYVNENSDQNIKIKQYNAIFKSIKKE